MLNKSIKLNQKQKYDLADLSVRKHHALLFIKK